MMIFAVVAYFCILIAALIILDKIFAKRKYIKLVTRSYFIIGLTVFIINGQFYLKDFFTVKSVTFLFTCVIPYIVFIMLLYNHFQITNQYKQ